MPSHNRQPALILRLVALSPAVLAMAGVNAHAQASVPADQTPTLAPVVVESSRTSQLGVADSANSGVVTQKQLEARTVYRAGELLEATPGLIVSQHSGEGKANQFYLRGFNLDHGTDLRTTIDGMLVNQRSHAHGQGWTDLNFLIPELTTELDYRKGPYYAAEGDFSSAGAVSIHYADKLDHGISVTGIGQNGFRRLLLADSPKVGDGRLLYALELYHNDGPFVRPDNYGKVNSVLRYSQGTEANGFNVTAMAYRAKWNATDQIPRHIDELEALGGLVFQIINKHVSLQIQPEHYPVVGAGLLRAIREVLGAEVATDAVIDAWGAAYGQLADILIGAEEAIYAATAAAPGGWRGARAFTVQRKVAESAEITSFYLSPKDGLPVVAFLPGQYIGIRLVVDGQEIRRNYSLSAAPNGYSYRISVKRQPGGVASNYLHDKVDIGDVVELFPPAGNFVLAAGGKPLVLISGGIGITPTLAMLEAALPSGRPVHFIHFARNREVHAFSAALSQLKAEHANLNYFYVYDESTNAADAQAGPHAIGRLNSIELARFLPATNDVDAYFLGPKMFMRQMKRQLAELGVPPGQAKYEFFGPASDLE